LKISARSGKLLSFPHTTDSRHSSSQPLPVQVRVKPKLQLHHDLLMGLGIFLASIHVGLHSRLHISRLFESSLGALLFRSPSQ
jgi:hypothetical protein